MRRSSEHTELEAVTSLAHTVELASEGAYPGTLIFFAEFVFRYLTEFTLANERFAWEMFVLKIRRR